MKNLTTSILLTFTIIPLSAGPTGSGRPAPKDRCFRSEAVERTISEVCSSLSNPKLAGMFENCFPNTLDTTVEFTDGQDGSPDTFVITGDIHAMWLRDSGAQVWPYLRLAGEDEHLRRMIAGVILRQLRCIAIDPYANAFNKGPSGSEWEKDMTEMNPWLHERKWELDSPCYVIRLAHGYWKATGDSSIFGKEWIDAVRAILRTFREQQRYDGPGPYSFMRRTERAYDTKGWDGHGAPVKPCGLIASSFRPSDDATVLEFLIPSNFFAVSSLRKAAEILSEVSCKKGQVDDGRTSAEENRTLTEGNRTLADESRTLADGNRTLTEESRTLVDGNRTLTEESRTLVDGNRTLTEESRTLTDGNRTLTEESRTLTDECKALADECKALADEVEAALKKYAIVKHPKYGRIYAYEVDGFGNALMMDDANVPNLLSMPYLGSISEKDPVWRNTRRFVLSEDNPCYFSGSAGAGVGGPHIGNGWIWPMSIIMQAFTATSDKEIAGCLKTLLSSDAGTGFMHEAFWKDDSGRYTRKWFAWANTLFGELILDLYQKGKLDLLNSL